MKNFFTLDSLNKKLLSIFLTLTMIPLGITVIVIYFATDQGFTKLISNQQKEMEHTIQTQFNRVAEDLLDITTKYANDEKFVSAFQSGDRDILLQEVNQNYSRLQEEHGMDIFEFGDASGKVFLRGHNPDKYGDDKSELPAVQSAIDGQAIAGFEFGSSGLSVRAFAPILFNDKVIGTLQTGVDDTFLNELNEMLQGVNINLYNQEGTVVVSSEETNIGGTIDEKSILTSVMQGETISRSDNGYLESYLPMYDPTQSEIIGVIGINQDIAVIQDTKQSIIKIALMITAITVLIVLVVSIRFSKSISNPIKKLTRLMVELSKGNLKISIEDSKRNDEIGQLTESMQVMKGTLHNTIKQVAAASTNVATQSEELTQSAIEVKTGSEQIAFTMEEISAGTEKQADRASRLANNVGMFASKVQITNEKGEQIQVSSLEILELTDKGKQLMESSNKQMMKIDEMVQGAVKEMDKLDNQTKEISQLVSIIQQVANQTNLLALNAAIEAARAGEQGKGFAVVADEVRKLAEQVSRSVTDITGIVDNIQGESSTVADSLKAGYKEVEQGTMQIKTTSETFNKISSSVTDMVSNIQHISENLSDIAASSQEMNGSIEEIAAISEESASGIEETSATTQQSSSSMEEVARGSEQLAKLAEELNELVRHFKL
jgi:methyl-accepting chemotaxis protein